MSGQSRKVVAASVKVGRVARILGAKQESLRDEGRQSRHQKKVIDFLLPRRSTEREAARALVPGVPIDIK